MMLITIGNATSRKTCEFLILFFNRMCTIFWRYVHFPSKFLTDPAITARQKYRPHHAAPSCNNFWRTPKSVKISVKNSFDGNVSPSKTLVKILLTRCQSVSKCLQENFDGMSVRRKLSVKKFWRISQKLISTKHFLTDILPVKISVKNITFRQKL